MDNQEERTVIVTDGAYSGTENTQLAAYKQDKGSGNTLQLNSQVAG